MFMLLSRLARTARTRWRAVSLLIGGVLTVAGIMLPSGAVLVPGLLIFLFALLKQAEAPDCRAAAQLAGWRWHG